MLYRFLPHTLKCYSKKALPIDERKILPDVIVTLTTIPARIDKIWPTLNSILLQSILPSKVYLWIPKSYKRFNGISIKKIPDFLINHPLIEVRFIDEDYGPATKLLPCFKMPIPPDTKIIVIDDDCVYAPNVISKLNKYAERNPNSAITFVGSDIISGVGKKYENSLRGKRVDILHGYGSYLVKPKFFSDDVFAYPENHPEFFFEDDAWISGNLRKTQTKILIPPNLWRCRVSSKQNKILSHKRTKSHALCKNENQDGINLIKSWLYFQALKND